MALVSKVAVSKDCVATGFKRESVVATRKGTKRVSVTRRSCMGTLRKQSKVDLLRQLIDPESTSVDQILAYTRMTRPQLWAEIRRVHAAVTRASRARCPKGCAPGDPNCTLDHWIVTITPVESPFTDNLPKVASRSSAHEWLTDTLTPMRASATELIMSGQENLKALLQVIEEQGLQDTVNMQKLREMYLSLDAQFPKRKPWWRRWLDAFDAYADYNWKLLQHQYGYYFPKKEKK